MDDPFVRGTPAGPPLPPPGESITRKRNWMERWSSRELLRRARALWLGDDENLSGTWGDLVVQWISSLSSSSTTTTTTATTDSKRISPSVIHTAYSSTFSNLDLLSRQDLLEEIYRQVWQRRRDHKKEDNNHHHHHHQAEEDEGEEEEEALRRQAGEKWAFLLLQRGATSSADPLLSSLGYTCRLARSVLHYAPPPTDSPSIITSSSSSSFSSSIPCQIWDDFLTRQEQEILQQVFVDPHSTYWTDHDYAVEPPSPYFSYLIPLSSPSSDAAPPEFGCLGQLIRRIQQHILQRARELDQQENNNDHHQQGRPGSTSSTWSSVAQATMCEMWAHHRPSVTGHQMHFDSDNEGQADAVSTGNTLASLQDRGPTTVVRHPLVSTILYLTGPPPSSSSSSSSRASTSASSDSIMMMEDSNHGQDLSRNDQHHPPPPDISYGPTLVTNQRLSSRRMADKGWLCHPVRHRLVAMDGRVLHGVIPGPLPRKDHVLHHWIRQHGQDAVGLPSAGEAHNRPEVSSTGAPRHRVTVMLAFWKRIQARPGPGPGAARPFPRSRTEGHIVDLPEWARLLCTPPLEADKARDNNPYRSDHPRPHPVRLDCVYECTETGQPWTKQMGFPDYEQVFQGF